MSGGILFRESGKPEGLESVPDFLSSNFSYGGFGRIRTLFPYKMERRCADALGGFRRHPPRLTQPRALRSLRHRLSGSETERRPAC